MEEELERAIRQRLVAELRDSIHAIMTSTLMISPLVQREGGSQEILSLNSMTRSLYSLLRTAQHLDLLEDLRDPNDPGERRMVDLGDLLTDLCRQIEDLTSDLGCTFRWRGDVEEMVIMGDTYLLSVAVLNLVTNAVQAVRTRKDTQGLISFQWKRQKSTCQITIRDNGPGLEGFTPWQGTGIGLQVARRCLESHGGTLMLDSSPTGVTAVITLPLANPEEGEKLLLTDRTSGFSPLLTEFAPYLSPGYFAKINQYS